MAIKGNSRLFTLICLLIILTAGGFFRLWHLNSVPPGIYPDEAMNANDAIASPGKLFYPDNNGREGLFINLISLSFSIFGVSIWSFKIVPALVGTATIAGLYLLTKEVFQKNIALLSSFFLAVSFWHINFSRIGFRAIMVPLILTFGFYFLFRGFRTNNLWHFIFSGLILGAGFYTYISYRFVVLLIPIALICWWPAYRQKNRQKRFLLSSFLFLLFIFIAALPIGWYFLENPSYFSSRATGVSIFSQENIFGSFVKSAVVHLGMFNFYGDPNWRHNFAGSPQLNWLEGALFLAGLFFIIKNSVRTVWQIRLVVLSWILIMLLPGILTYEGIPHALRTIGVIPAVYILAGIGGWHIYQLLSKKLAKKILVPLCLFFLIFSAYYSFQKYFIVWAAKPEVRESFTQNYNAMGDHLNSLPEETKKYVIVNEWERPLYGISIPGQTVQFIERTRYTSPRALYIKTDQLNEIQPGNETVIVPLYNGKLFDELEKIFPRGEKINKGLFDIYYIK